MLRPQIAILDELDSGLDIDALRACARRVEAATQPTGDEPGLGVLAITHYNRLLAELRPDHVHILVRGQHRRRRAAPSWPTSSRPTGYAAFTGEPEDGADARPAGRAPGLARRAVRQPCTSIRCARGCIEPQTLG